MVKSAKPWGVRRETITHSSAPSSLGRSRLTPGRGYRGTIPKGVVQVLAWAWENPIAVQSDYARANSTDVAFAASMGWLSTISPDGHSYSKLWRITAEGLITLRDALT